MKDKTNSFKFENSESLSVYKNLMANIDEYPNNHSFKRKKTVAFSNHNDIVLKKDSSKKLSKLNTFNVIKTRNSICCTCNQIISKTAKAIGLEKKEDIFSTNNLEILNSLKTKATSSPNNDNRFYNKSKNNIEKAYIYIYTYTLIQNYI